MDKRYSVIAILILVASIMISDMALAQSPGSINSVGSALITVEKATEIWIKELGPDVFWGLKYSPGNLVSIFLGPSVSTTAIKMIRGGAGAEYISAKTFGTILKNVKSFTKIGAEGVRSLDVLSWESNKQIYWAQLTKEQQNQLKIVEDKCGIIISGGLLYGLPVNTKSISDVNCKNEVQAFFALKAGMAENRTVTFQDTIDSRQNINSGGAR